MSVSIEDQILEISREIRNRHRVYKRMVENEEMSQAYADSRIATMEAVLSTLRERQAEESEKPALFKTPKPSRGDGAHAEE